MTDIDKLTSVLKDHKVEFEEEFGVSEIGVFGSSVEGKQRETSDIDILVEFRKAEDF